MPAQIRALIETGQTLAGTDPSSLQPPIVMPPIIMGPAEAPCMSMWCHVGHFINGEFFAAFFGAAAGAIVTYFVTTRHEREQALRRELSACNAAIGLTATVTSTAFLLKSQFLVGIRQRYAAEFARMAQAEMHQQAAAPGMHILFSYTFDFLYINAPFTLVDELRKVIIEKVPSSTNVQILVALLKQAANAQRRAIETRNAAITAVRSQFRRVKNAGPRGNTGRVVFWSSFATRSHRRVISGYTTCYIVLHR